MNENPLISVVVPVYREEGNIVPFLSRMEPILEKIGSYEIIFCLDPSPDRTEEIINQEIARNSKIGLMLFSRRFGQPAATMAGIFNCRGKFCVVIDVDLQDPPELIVDLYNKAQEGFEVVYAKRKSREGETAAKKIVSWAGYWVINQISDVKIPRDTGDFRIISRRVIEALRRLPEGHGFLRGLVAFAGFRQTFVEYERDPRLAGEGKYNRFIGSLKIGFNGIFGFSTAPLKISFIVGLLLTIWSFIEILMLLFAIFVQGKSFDPGIPTLMVAIPLFAGVQLMSLGIIGEYIGRIYDEVRNRPLYIMDKVKNIQVSDAWGPNTGSNSSLSEK